MHDLRMSGSGRKLKPEDIANAEERHGFRVPEPYRAFLLVHNGGHPDRCCFRYGAGPYRDSMVGEFLDIRGKGGSLPATLFNTAGRYAAHLFPIANDPAGNLILLSTGKGTQGAIFFWDHEAEGEAAIHPIAETLDDFIAMLTEEE